MKSLDTLPPGGTREEDGAHQEPSGSLLRSSPRSSPHGAPPNAGPRASETPGSLSCPQSVACGHALTSRAGAPEAEAESGLCLSRH